MLRFNRAFKKLALIGFIAAEILFLKYLWQATEPTSIRAALAKEGQNYVLRWVNTDNTVEVKVFSSPLQAIGFASERLKLKPGSNPASNDFLENIWTRQAMSKHIVFWKTVNLNMVHRLTFNNENHAKTFVTAFKKGAYSPSPIGHSIHFVKANIQ